RASGYAVHDGEILERDDDAIHWKIPENNKINNAREQHDVERPKTPQRFERQMQFRLRSRLQARGKRFDWSRSHTFPPSLYALPFDKLSIITAPAGPIYTK